MPDYKQDNRPKRLGWAPGDYCNCCVHCDGFFTGDKRATHCADCAYCTHETTPAPPQPVAARPPLECPMTARTWAHTTTLYLFGREVTISTRDREAALELTEEWDVFLRLEWERVREASAVMMERYTAELLAAGAPLAAVEKALDKVIADAAK